MFIDLSGIDGSGKSTVAMELKKAFEQKGRECIVFHGYIPRKNINLLRDICTKAGIQRENSSFVNSLGMAAALMDVFVNSFIHIIPNSNKIFISEKYIKDSVVYMPLLGGNVELPLMYEKNMPRPDYRFILDIDPYIARKRVEKRGKYIQEKESYEIMKNAREVFLSFSNEDRTYIINADRKVDTIVNEILSIIFCNQS